MEDSNGKLRLFVKSKRVPTRMTEFSIPIASGPWTISHSIVRAVVYESVLDDVQARLVEEAKRLSDISGLDLEVVDLGRMGSLRRIFWSRIVGSGPAPTPIGARSIQTSSSPSCVLS
jgi:hypothetical protein